MIRGRFLARSLQRNRELLTDPAYQSDLMRVLRRNGILPPIMGAAINLIAGVASEATQPALTTGVVNLFPTAGNPLVLNTPGTLPATPWAIAFAYVQEITGISAGATATVAISQIAGATTTQIGGGVSVNQAAGTGPIDTGIFLGLVSGPVQRLTSTAQLSTGTGTVQNSATLPSIFGALSFL